MISTELSNGELVLLDFQSGAYYTLNQTGLCIWQGINQGYAIASIGQALATQYEVTQAQHYTMVLVKKLLAEKLIEVCPN